MSKKEREALAAKITSLPLENQLLLAAQLFVIKDKQDIAIAIAENAVTQWRTRGGERL